MISRINFGPDRKTLLRLYWALGKSKLDYGSQIYSSASTNVLETLNPVHNEALRICSGAFRSSPITSLLVETGNPPLDLQREEQCLRYLTRLESNQQYMEDPNKLNVLEDHYDDEYKNDDSFMAPVGTRARSLQRKQDLLSKPILNQIPEESPWLLRTINICKEGATAGKQNASAAQLKQEFESHLRKHTNSNHIYTDGSKSQETVGYGLAYGHDFKKTVKAALPGEASIFTAELSAILRALTIVKDSVPLSWTIFSDSQAAIQAVAHPNPKHPLVRSIQSLLIELQNLNKKITFCKVPSHVGIRGNEAADRAANDAQKIPGLATTYVPHRDHNLPFRRNIMKKWQSRWDRVNEENNGVENKLRRVKTSVYPWKNLPGGNRRNEVKIARLRIGHTRLTHGYRMKRGRPPDAPDPPDPPSCSKCRESPLTVDHFLFNCRTTLPLRNRLKLPNTPEQLLGEQCPVPQLMEYLQTIGVLEEI